MKNQVLAILMLLAPFHAAAAERGEWYVQAEGGVNLEGAPLSTQKNTRISTDTGGVGAVSAGYRFANHLRLEVEGSFRSNSVGGVNTLREDGLLLPLSGVAGDTRSYAILANALYDLPLGRGRLPFQPYVGAGVGYTSLDDSDLHGIGFANLSLPEHNTFSGPVNVRFGAAPAFAYQAIAGVSTNISKSHRLKLLLEYRFFGASRANIRVSRVSTSTDLVNGAVPAATTHNGFVLQDNSILLGLRYGFGPGAH